MTMESKFKPTDQIIKLPAGDVTLEFIDESGCHVDVVLVVQGYKGVTFHFEDEGRSSVQKTYTLKTKERYTCSVALYGYSYKALNRSYSTVMKINGETCLTAKGTLPKDPGFDNVGALFYFDVA